MTSTDFPPPVPGHTVGRLAPLGVEIDATAHQGLIIQHAGRPATLAVLDEHGRIVAQGPDVARECEAVAQACMAATWAGRGHLRVLARPKP